MQESMDECISLWNSRWMFLSLPLLKLESTVTSARPRECRANRISRQVRSSLPVLPSQPTGGLREKRKDLHHTSFPWAQVPTCHLGIAERGETTCSLSIEGQMISYLERKIQGCLHAIKMYWGPILCQKLVTPGDLAMYTKNIKYLSSWS